jgi:hypothetical protein
MIVVSAAFKKTIENLQPRLLSVYMTGFIAVIYRLHTSRLLMFHRPGFLKSDGDANIFQ